MQQQKHIVFALSKVGASHIPERKPCQDFSLVVNEDGLRMVVVCDGHGSSTYVRSDIGARLAAEVTKKAVKTFVMDTPPELFKGKKGAVTVRPTAEDIRRDAGTKPSDINDEEDKQIREQNHMFITQVRDILEQDIIITALLRKIYSAWLTAIKEDCHKNPLTDTEKAALGNKPLVKAYGSTLMAFIETPHYWLAFHIGDGRIVAIDNELNMTNPVPWDCNCFLNVTTSLCNNNPVRLFRYAFDGTGNFPAAVLCCSDGIEDSYGNYELAPHILHEWYASVLGEFCQNGEKETLERMDAFFPLLSEKGSHDDISLAGIIDTEAVAKGLEVAKIKQQISEIEQQKDNTNQQMEELSRQVEELNSQMVDFSLQKSELERKLCEINQEDTETDCNRAVTDEEHPNNTQTDPNP